MTETELAAARRALRRDRARGLVLLEDLFAAGQPPNPPLDGRSEGELVVLDLAPVATQVLTALTSVWLPWQGKTFDAALSRGDNIFAAGSKPAARIFNPGYRHFLDDGPDSYRAFAFHTYEAGARGYPSHTVLKIDYDLPENPRATIRRVLDELVQIDDGLFLGKAHVRWWSGRWQRIAFFNPTCGT